MSNDNEDQYEMAVEIDISDEWNIRDGPKVQVKNPEFFLDMQKCIEHFEVKCRFEEMGIMCLRPPEECIPQLFDFAKGAEGWRNLQNEMPIDGYSEQVITRPNMEKAPHLTMTRHKDHNKKRSLGEFMALAKKQLRYNPISKNLTEAEKFFWEGMADIGKEGCPQPSQGAFYAYTIDGSFMKTLDGKDRVR